LSDKHLFLKAFFVYLMKGIEQSAQHFRPPTPHKT